jgi:hypothetical protein
VLVLVLENSFKKKSKKMLTPALLSGILVSHTVLTEQQHNTKMRTKTLLLTAAALLAAGITSTQAQPVYSQNIVGYASVATPSSGINYLITIPFAIGVSNGANEIWPVVGGVPTLPDFSTILIWNPAIQNYAAYTSDSGSPSGWDDNSGYLSYSPVLPVGQGFFLSPSAPVTNVFAGTIAVNVGTSNKMVLPSSGINYLVGCVVPYAGAITNGNPATGAGGPNLTLAGGLPDFSTILIWDPAIQNYTAYTSDSGSPSGWDDNNGYLLTSPTITVGQGFFISPSAPFTWTVGL